MSILIFHSPMPIERLLDSGSAVRPKRMLEAFRAIGQEVLLVDGESRRRRRIWREVMAIPPDRLVGVYSELSTTPIALTDPDHLPRSPFMDAKAFRRLRDQGVPTSVFYRDVHWRFPQYDRAISRWKRFVGRGFHYLELRQIVEHVDIVFLPTTAMLRHVPFTRAPRRIAPLPPGCASHPRPRRTDGSSLRLLYVGGVGPPNYDLEVMLDAVRATEQCELRICCRAGEWSAQKERYCVPGNARVEHVSGPDLEQLFAWADALLFWCPTNTYLDFSMPVKVFESLGWCLPTIVNGSTEFGRFIRDSGAGFAPRLAAELRPLLERLRDDRSLLVAAADAANKIAPSHTWEARARTVLETLCGIREASR